MVTVGLLLVVVHRRLLLVSTTVPTVLPVNKGLGNIRFGPKTFKACDARSQGATGGPGVEVDIHGGGNTRPRSISCYPDAVGGEVLLMSHTQLVQSFKMHAQPAWRTHLEVVVVGPPPGSDDSAVLGEVNVPVDVAVAVDVGEAVPLWLCVAVLSRGAGLVLSIHHQLDSLLSPGLEKTNRKRGKRHHTYNS